MLEDVEALLAQTPADAPVRRAARDLYFAYGNFPGLDLAQSSARWKRAAALGWSDWAPASAVQLFIQLSLAAVCAGHHAEAAACLRQALQIGRTPSATGTARPLTDAIMTFHQKGVLFQNFNTIVSLLVQAHSLVERPDDPAHESEEAVLRRLVGWLTPDYGRSMLDVNLRGRYAACLLLRVAPTPARSAEQLAEEALEQLGLALYIQESVNPALYPETLNIFRDSLRRSPLGADLESRLVWMHFCPENKAVK